MSSLGRKERGVRQEYKKRNSTDRKDKEENKKLRKEKLIEGKNHILLFDSSCNLILNVRLVETISSDDLNLAHKLVKFFQKHL